MNWRKFSYAVLFVTVFVGLLSLGYWQYSRYRLKTHWLRALQQGQNQLPLNNADLKNNHWAPFRKITLTGHWLNDKTLVISGAFQHERPGFWVVTPWQWAPNEPWVLVNRGWVAATDGRHHPHLKPASPMPVVSGKIYRPTGTRYVMGNWRLSTSSQPAVVQDWDFQKMEKLLGHSVKPFVLRMSPNLPGVYEREWSWSALPPSRHLSYMWQWWALALVWLVGAIFWFQKDKGEEE